MLRKKHRLIKLILVPTCSGICSRFRIVLCAYALATFKAVFVANHALLPLTATFKAAFVATQMFLPLTATFKAVFVATQMFLPLTATFKAVFVATLFRRPFSARLTFSLLFERRRKCPLRRICQCRKGHFVEAHK